MSEEKRIYELTEQTSLVTGDVLLLDNPTLAEARYIQAANLLAVSPVQLAQEPPADDGWKPVILSLSGENPALVGADGTSWEVDLSALIDTNAKGVFIEAFVEETGGVTPCEARLSPLDAFPTGVIVASEVLSQSVYIPTTFVAVGADRKIYLRLLSVGGSPSTVNVELNFLGAV